MHRGRIEQKLIESRVLDSLCRLARFALVVSTAAVDPGNVSASFELKKKKWEKMKEGIPYTELCRAAIWVWPTCETRSGAGKNTAEQHTSRSSLSQIVKGILASRIIFMSRTELVFNGARNGASGS
jgi:hypothetical protein